MDIVFLFIGLLIGFGVVYFFYKKQSLLGLNELQNQLLRFEKEKLEELQQLNIEKALDKKNIENLQLEISQLQKIIEAERINYDLLRKEKTASEIQNKSMEEKLHTQAEEIEKLNEKFNKEFQLIASRILRENTKDITEIHNKNINDLLSPLKEKLSSFEKKVEETYDKELRDKVDLKAELRSLHELNKRISEEANNLTKALKGDSKKQGNWGEIILERVLERSGLTKGQEYFLQYSTLNEEGKRIQPDVIISLPDKKSIIIDAKVSLIAYEKFINADDEKEKQLYLKEHLSSVKTHVNSLSEKKYQNAEEFITPEFVLLFMPIESSFSTAIQSDIEIFSYAWDRKIVVVSPTTLLATLRTIASIWKQENQTKNAIEIARQGGNLYDKFISFISELEKIGKNIEALSKTHNEAMKKLSTGTGNLVKRAEDLRELGVKTTKSLSEKYIEDEEKSL
ncbi:MAG: DNA recombination protein RmuC [Bacteroidales bacterium]|nr:DNA recombination protein RmuC [Bacteroidales bacterium]